MLKQLFTPVKIGKLELKNRLVVSPMVTNYCAASGDATEKFIAYHEEKAKGGWGLIMTENFVVVDEGRGFTYVGGLHTDDVIESHRKLTDRVHAQDGKIFAQIIHCGRETTCAVSHAQPVAPSALPCPVNQDMPHALTAEEIHVLVQKFGDAALRAKKAGYDGIEINGAHGYLVAQFMSTYSNKRTDEYGGVLYNRMRFVREILEDIRGKVGEDYPVVFRISAVEGMPGGRQIEDTCAIAELLEQWGVDAIDVSMGVYGDDYTIPAMTTHHAWSTNLARQVKEVVGIPVITVGRINDPILADSVIAAGKADMVSMGRGSLADPWMPAKAQKGDFASIRQCIACMQGCTGYLGLNEPIRCLVNPSLGHEQMIQNLEGTLRGKAVVIGGGPAGLEAARILALRGAQVALYDERDYLGGDFAIAAVPPFKGELASYVSWARNELQKLKVEVHLGRKMDEQQVIGMKPDIVVLATGSRTARPKIKGIDGPNVVTAQEVLAGKVVTGERVVIIGGGMVGTETAAHTVMLGREVTMLEMTDRVAAKVADAIRTDVMELLKQKNASIVTEATVVEIGPEGVRYQSGGKEHFIEADTVVLASGAVSNRDMREPLENAGLKVITVGDAQQAVDAINATASGFMAALEVE